MTGMHERTELLIGAEGLARLAGARVAVFGLGGVGGAAAEMLCRAGVGALTLVDFDRVAESNLNRQLLALRSTLGMPKAEAAARRLADIAPGCRVEALEALFCAEEAQRFDLAGHDFVVDCIDTLRYKAELIHACVAAGTPLAVSAGAGRRSDPTGVRMTDLYAIQGCPLSRVLRKRLRKKGVFGPIPAAACPAPPEPPTPLPEDEQAPTARRPIGSISFVPAVFGCVLAAYAVRHLLGDPMPLAPWPKTPGIGNEEDRS